MKTDRQVIKLRQLLGRGMPLYRAAWKVDMDAKTARKYRQADHLPSESLTPRSWQTREDPVPGRLARTRGSAGAPSRAPSQDSLRGSPAAVPGPVS